MKVNGIEFPAEHADTVCDYVLGSVEETGYSAEEALLGVVKALISLAAEFPEATRGDVLVAVAEIVEEAR